MTIKIFLMGENNKILELFILSIGPINHIIICITSKQLMPELFCSGYGFRPHVNDVFGNRNRSFLKTVSRL